MDELENFGSDHSPLIFKVTGLNPIGSNLGNTRCVKITNWTKFRTKLEDTELSLKKVSTKQELEDNLLKFESAINNAFTEATTTKEIKVNEPLVLPERIVKLIKENRKMRNIFLKSRDMVVKIRVNQLNAQISGTLNHSAR